MIFPGMHKPNYPTEERCEKMKSGIKVLSLVGIVLFIIILTRINLDALVDTFAHTNLALLVVALGVNCIAILLKSLKWKMIVNSVKPEFSLKESIIAFFVGFSFSTITPAKIGDFIKVLYIRDKKCGFGVAFSTVVIDRLIDIVLLFSVALIGIAGFSAIFHIEILSIGTVLLMVLGIVAGIVVVLNKRFLAALLRPFFNIFVPPRLKCTFGQYYHDFYSGLFAFYRDRTRFISTVATGIVSWIPPFVYGWILALALGINIGFFYFILVIPVISLLDLLPISISGIGTRDVALIFLFGLEGIPAEQAIAFSLLYLFMSYWLIALMGAGVYLKFPVKIPEEWN
jgi:uncharacterized protein (TIRG00374 family)